MMIEMIVYMMIENLLTRKTMVPMSRTDPIISMVGYITDRAT